MTTNIVTATFGGVGGVRKATTRPLYQYDYGQILQFARVTLPDVYEVHFSNAENGTATTQIGTSEGVSIPDMYLTSGQPIYAWMFLHTGESDGETRYEILIPVKQRARATDAPPTPEQQSVITEAIAALNTGVQKAEEAQRAWENMSAEAETLPEGVKCDCKL